MKSLQKNNRKAKHPFVSVVISNFNGRKMTYDCLKTVLQTDYPKKQYEIIVVDNASQDGSVDFLKKEFAREIKEKRIRILQNKENLGATGANNIGHTAAKGKYVLYLNNDTFVPKKWMKPLVDTLESDRATAVVCSMWYHIGQKLTEKNGEKLTVSPICTGKSDTDKTDNRTLLPTACSCLLRKGLFNPPFDNDYFIYQDDVYLGWMAWLRGYKALINYESKLWHIGAATVGFFNYRQVYLNERNRIMTILIFLKARSILLLMPIFIIDFIFRFFYSLFSRRLDLLKAEFDAIWYNIANAKRILKKRKKMQKTRKVCDYEILDIMCEDVYGRGSVKGIMNSLFKAYFRFVKRVCKIFKI